MKQAVKKTVILLFLTLYAVSCTREKKGTVNPVSETRYTGDAVVSTTVRKTPIRTSGFLEVELKVATEENCRVEFPAALGLTGFTDICRLIQPAALNDREETVHSALYTLEPTVPGSFRITPQYIKIIRNLSVRKITAPGIAFEVRSLFKKGEKKDLKEIEPPIETGNGSWTGTATGVLLTAVALLIILSLRRKDSTTESCGSGEELEKTLQDVSTPPERVRKLFLRVMEEELGVNLHALSNREILSAAAENPAVPDRLLDEMRYILEELDRCCFSVENELNCGQKEMILRLITELKKNSADSEKESAE